MAKKSREDTGMELFDIPPDELDAAVAGLPDDESTLTIYRLKAIGQGHPIFVATYAPHEFSLETIQQNHGGGKYNIVAKRGSEVFKKYRVEIEGEPKLITGTVPLAARKPGGFNTWWTKKQLDEEEQKVKTAGVDPSIMLLMNEIRNLKESLQNANSSGGKSDRREFLEELVMFKSLFAPPSNPVADNSKMVTELIQKGLEIGANAASGEAPGNSWISIIRELLPIAQQAISAAVAKQNAMLTVSRPIQPAPVASNGTAPVNNPLKVDGIADILPGMNREVKPTSGFATIAPMLTVYAPLLIGLASRDGDPNTAIELIENNLSDEQKPHVIEWLGSPSWFTDLCSVDRRIELQAAWWHELQSALLATLRGETEAETEAEQLPD